DTFILSPQSHPELVRERLLERDYSIVYDRVAQDGGKFYDILQAKRGGGKEQLARTIPLQLAWGMFLQEKNEALRKKLRAREAALASYPPTQENLRKLRQVKEALLWQLR
ncbi:MAG: class I SAM-dependent methyltransferase, partial [Clostridiales bacterium]|nr:class I SAM-dependent methyltransferase [Clostridiales bacterium]